MINLIFATIWLISTPLQAADYCVSPSGNNGSSGIYDPSYNNCWATTLHGANNVDDGDTLCLSPGTHNAFEITDSGSSSNRIQFKNCPGVKGDPVNNCIFEESDVNNWSNDAIIRLSASNITIGSFDDPMHFCKSVYKSGFKLLDGNGNNNFINNLHYLGDEIPGTTLNSERNQDGRNGTSLSRIRALRLIGNDNIWNNITCKSWHFQCMAFSTATTTRPTISNSYFDNTWSHVISIDKKCNGQSFFNVAGLLINNYFGQSFSSDSPGQTNIESYSDNPNPDYGSNIKFPCKGNFRLTRNATFLTGENFTDWKGGIHYVTQGNNGITFLGQASDGQAKVNVRSVGPAYTTNHAAANITRFSVGFDGPQCIRVEKYAAAYNNSCVNLTRGISSGGSPQGPGAADPTRSDIGGGWQGTGSIINNVFASLDSLIGVGSFSNSDIKFGGNVFEDTRPRWNWNSDNSNSSDISSWKAYIAAQNNIDQDESTSVTASIEDIFVDQGFKGTDKTDGAKRLHLGHTSIDYPLEHLDFEDIVPYLTRFTLKNQWATGGQPVADVESSSTGTTITLGNDATHLCCRTTDDIPQATLNELICEDNANCTALETQLVNQIYDGRRGDLIEISGPSTPATQVRIESINDSNGDLVVDQITVDQSVTLVGNENIHIVCVGGMPCDTGTNMTETRGSWYHWTGFEDDPPPIEPPDPPPLILPQFKMAKSEYDGYEVSDGTVDITSTSIPLGTAGQTSDLFDQIISDGANDCRNAIDSTASCTSDYIQMIRNWGWMKFVDSTSDGTCTSAVIEVVATQDRNGGLTTIYGQNQLDPSTPSGFNAIQALPQTTASVDWDMPALVAGETATSPDLCPIIDELMALPGYTPGSSDFALISSGEILTGRRSEVATAENTTYTAPRIVLNSQSGAATGASYAAFIIDFDVTQQDIASNVEIIIVPDTDYSNSFNLTIEGLKGDIADLAEVNNNITNRTNKTAPISCPSVGNWTQDTTFVLTDAICPGLTNIVNEMIQDVGFNKKIGFVLEADTSRSIYSFDSNPDFAFGVNATVQVLDQPNLIVPSLVNCVVGVSCVTEVTAIDSDGTTCSSLVVNDSNLPIGNDGNLGSPDVNCLSQYTWTPQVGDEVADYDLIFTATAANSATVQRTTRLTTVASTADSKNIYIAEPNCDVEEHDNSSLIVGSNDLELNFNPGNNRYQEVGLCFNGLPVTPEKTITGAYILMQAFGDSSGDIELTLNCEDTGNAATFVQQNFELTNRTRTQKSITWNPPALLDGNFYILPQMRDIIQEIVNRPDWQVNNQIACFINGNRQGAYFRNFYSYEEAQITQEALAPMLYIEWADSTTLRSDPSIIGDTVIEDPNGQVFTSNPL